MTLGDLVKNYREKNNITMDEFSKTCSLSKGYISMLENNTNIKLLFKNPLKSF